MLVTTCSQRRGLRDTGSTTIILMPGEALFTHVCGVTLGAVGAQGVLHDRPRSIPASRDLKSLVS
jgi:hypothetical protein